MPPPRCMVAPIPQRHRSIIAPPHSGDCFGLKYTAECAFNPPAETDIMFEYIFFDAALRDKFVEYASNLGVKPVLRDDQMGMIVEIPEDIEEVKENAIEQRYDELEFEQSQLLLEEEGGLKRIAGFNFKLPDGQSRMVPLQADIASRLLATFTLEEIQTLFASVAGSALNPSEEHLCKILAAQNKLA